MQHFHFETIFNIVEFNVLHAENISGMFIVFWQITHQPLQPQKMNGFLVTEWIWFSICLEKTQD